MLIPHCDGHILMKWATLEFLLDAIEVQRTYNYGPEALLHACKWPPTTWRVALGVHLCT